MNILDAFPDWKKSTGDVYQLTQTYNAADQVIETDTLIQSGVKFWKWVTTSLQTNISDKFVDSQVGNLVLDPRKITFTPNVNMFIIDQNGDRYNFNGVDDVMTFGEMIVLRYTKQYE